MKERPILFSGAMVRALLDGSKTQTRRVLKPAPQMVTHNTITTWDGTPAALQHQLDRMGKGCPYGQPGDRLWVREAFDFLPSGGPDQPQACEIVYWATGSTESRTAPSDYNPMIYGHQKVRPSIHMPRWASRITLEITEVRVERLQDISEADALAEGIVRQPDGGYGLADTTHYHFTDPRQSYFGLWEAINGDGSVEANPWVWVVEFKPPTTA